MECKLVHSVSLTPSNDCSLCPRLVDYRHRNKIEFPDGWNAPVPVWGSVYSEFLIVGLAPGVKGANLTGRPFTGDFAGTLLYETLIKYGFAKGQYRADPNDGLTLQNCRIVNAVRCVPPANKPTSEEEKKCRSFLKYTIEQMTNLKVILSLGVIAHKNVLTCFGLPISKNKFKHGQRIDLSHTVTLVDSYHVSRYNTNTGVLTTPMFENVINSIKNTINP